MSKYLLGACYVPVPCIQDPAQSSLEYPSSVGTTGVSTIVTICVQMRLAWKVRSCTQSDTATRCELRLANSILYLVHHDIMPHSIGGPRAARTEHDCQQVSTLAT